MDMPFRWTERGMQQLPVVSPGDFALVYAANQDGSALAGFSGSNAALWRGDAVQDLGVIPDGTFSLAYAISANGRVVAGMCGTADYTLVACLWTDPLGMVDLRTHLASLGVDLSGWTLQSVNGLSADGSTLTGAGTFNGEPRAWVVRVPSIEGDRGRGSGRSTGAHRHTHSMPVRLPGRFPFGRR